MKNSEKVLCKVCDCIIQNLEELTELADYSQFVNGQIIAFVECLEILSAWKGFVKYGVKDVEQRFPID